MTCGRDGLTSILRRRREICTSDCAVVILGSFSRERPSSCSRLNTRCGAPQNAARKIESRCPFRACGRRVRQSLRVRSVELPADANRTHAACRPRATALRLHLVAAQDRAECGPGAPRGLNGLVTCRQRRAPTPSRGSASSVLSRQQYDRNSGAFAQLARELHPVLAAAGADLAPRGRWLPRSSMTIMSRPLATVVARRSFFPRYSSNSSRKSWSSSTTRMCGAGRSRRRRIRTQAGTFGGGEQYLVCARQALGTAGPTISCRTPI